MASDSAAKAAKFRRLHHGPGILILPNAWDAASARVFEAAGFPAIATTSAGVAASLGYPDGESIPREEMLAAVARIAGAVSVPVTADVEAGYGDSPAEAAATAAGVMAAGAVGLNLEDRREGRMLDAPAHAARVRAVRQAGEAAGVPLVINARTDVYLFEVGAPETRLEETVRRALAYRDAGADCVFVPGVSHGPTIERLARAIGVALNVLGGPGTPPAAELQRLGVARVSTGSGPMRATLALVRRIAGELKERGTFSFTGDAMPYADVYRLMSR